MLNERQQHFYTYRVSLYRPTPIEAYPDQDSAIDNAKDLSWLAVPAYVNVPCKFKSTPEVDLPSAEGLNKEANIFTLDKFSFDIVQEIAGQWVIQITAPQIPGVTGGWWYVQDNSKSTPDSGGRFANRQQVFAKRGDPPGFIAP